MQFFSLTSHKEKELKETLFDKAFDAHFNRVVIYINRYCNDFETAKNITQEVFMTYWENMEKVDQDKTVLPYLLRLAKNKTLNYLNRDNLHKRYTDKTLKTEGEYALLSLKNSNIEKIYEKDIEEIFATTLDEMSDSIRETYLLRLNKGLTNAKIAQELNISIRTVEYRMKKALQLLRLRLQDYLVTLLIFLFT